MYIQNVWIILFGIERSFAYSVSLHFQGCPTQFGFCLISLPQIFEHIYFPICLFVKENIYFDHSRPRNTQILYSQEYGISHAAAVLDVGIAWARTPFFVKNKRNVRRQCCREATRKKTSMAFAKGSRAHCLLLMLYMCDVIDAGCMVTVHVLGPHCVYPDTTDRTDTLGPNGHIDGWARTHTRKISCHNVSSYFDSDTVHLYWYRLTIILSKFVFTKLVVGTHRSRLVCVRVRTVPMK